MRRYWIWGILLFALIIPAANAAGITITSPQQEYYFVIGEHADITLDVTSSFSKDIEGTLQFSTTEQLQNAGTVMFSTKNRVYSHTVPPGKSFLNISGGTSDAEKSMKVQVRYDYTDTGPIQVSLPEIVIHFVKDASQAVNTQSPVTSTSGAGSAGGTPASSSVQIVQQAVSVQQQAGRDGSAQQQLTNGQMPQDSAALRQQMERKARQQEQDREDFKKHLNADPLISRVNESLNAEGFTYRDARYSPTGGDAGSFTLTYKNSDGHLANVQGTMENGTVPSVVTQAGIRINGTPVLAANASYQAFAAQLAADNFIANSTTLRQTLSDTVANISYQDPSGRQAFINATVAEDTVTQVSMDIQLQEKASPLPFIIAAILIIAVLAGIVLYRRWRLRHPVLSPAFVQTQTPGPPIDHYREAERLLTEAERAFGQQRYTEAYALLSRAIRLFVSYEYGDRTEISGAEVISLLTQALRDSTGIAEVLEQCKDIEFARGTSSPEEFTRMIAQAREFITWP